MSENENFPKYPAELYQTRPNETALLSPLYDSTFKAIFTQGTDDSNLALKSFLSAVLNRNILKTTLKPNEPVKDTRKQKNMSFDVSVEFDDGELADIELQARSQDYDFGMRAEIQVARLLTNNAKRGKKWRAQKVYQISVLNFQYKNDDNKDLRWYTMTDELCGRLTDRLNVIFIDLVAIRKLYKKISIEKLSPVQKWGLFFSYVDHEEKKDLIEKIAESEEGIMAADTIVEYMSKADANWFTQNSIWVAKRDAYTIKANALEKAKAEANEKARIENAKNFLSMNVLSIEQIAQGTGLPVEKVQKLAEEMRKN